MILRNREQHSCVGIDRTSATSRASLTATSNAIRQSAHETSQGVLGRNKDELTKHDRSQHRTQHAFASLCDCLWRLIWLLCHSSR